MQLPRNGIDYTFMVVARVSAGYIFASFTISRHVAVRVYSENSPGCNFLFLRISCVKHSAIGNLFGLILLIFRDVPVYIEGL